MRFFSAFLFFFFMGPFVSAQGFTSAVYECHFRNNFVATQSIRMKEYFDPQRGQRAGNIDLLDSLIPIESTPALIYQIPFWDQQFYVQIWYAPNVRVDSQMSFAGPNWTFPATYHKGALQQDLFCTVLSQTI